VAGVKDRFLKKWLDYLCFVLQARDGSTWSDWMVESQEKTHQGHEGRLILVEFGKSQ